MKRAYIFLFAFLLTQAFVGQTTANATGLSWCFAEGDYIDYRLISDGMIDDKIISFRIDSPLADIVELPPDTYNIGAFDHWMELPVVPVTAFIPSGGTPIEVDGFDNIFTWGGLSAGYWCRFALPSGISSDTLISLAEGWTSGPHGTINPVNISPPLIQQYLYWGITYDFEFIGSLYNVTAWYYESGDNRMGLLANVTIVAHNSTTHEQTHYMSLFTDWRAPIVASPGDMKFINFTVGTSGEEALWQVHDVEYPLSYEVYRNDTLVTSGSIELLDNRWIHVSLDDLEVGVWNYTIVVTDLLMNSVSDTVIVTVNSSFALGPEIILIAMGIAVVAVVAVVLKRR